VIGRVARASCRDWAIRTEIAVAAAEVTKQLRHERLFPC
jgi:hypothetical protein